jgi:hypothetical protein
MRIAFLLLAHQNPQIVKRLIDNVTAAGHCVAIHYDKNAPNSDYEFLRQAFADHPSVRFARRLRVGWGEWSIVAATLNCIEEIEAAGWNPDYVYYASGSDYPIRPASELADFLARNFGKQFIEGVPADTVRWVIGGPQEERYRYRFYFNWRTHRRLGEFLLRWQKRLRLKRPFVLGLEPYIGSQWWVLTWDAIQKIMKIGRRPEVIKFFRSTLIPDELYFQTLAYNIIPKGQIVSRPLTLYHFTDYMVPVVFCADKIDYLCRQPFFMARKLSPHRSKLFDALDQVWRGQHAVTPFADEQMGVVSDEYETTRLRNRDGAPGLPIVGKPVDGWAGGLDSVTNPFFAVLGASVAELRLAHMLLSRHEGLICHGQLLHPDVVELHSRAKSLGGLLRGDLALRKLSATHFLTDLIRGSCERQPGFLLRFGHGWHIPEVLFSVPAAKVVVIHGDLLVGFVESLAASEPLIDDPFDLAVLRRAPLGILVKKFSDYEAGLGATRERLDALVAESRAKGEPPNWSWLVEADLDLSKPPMLEIAARDCKGEGAQESAAPSAADPRATLPRDWVGLSLERWRALVAEMEACLGVVLTEGPNDPIWDIFVAELQRLQRARARAARLLAAGGLNPESTPALEPTWRQPLA